VSPLETPQQHAKRIITISEETPVKKTFVVPTLRIESSLAELTMGDPIETPICVISNCP